MCNDDDVIMICFRSRGLYFLNTNAKNPFAQGKNANSNHDEETDAFKTKPMMWKAGSI